MEFRTNYLDKEHAMKQLDNDELRLVTGGDDGTEGTIVDLCRFTVEIDGVMVSH